MALPGETSCRGVQVCDASRWGAIATSGDTEYVDAAYLGGPSDGSAERPWKTILQGMNAAAAGAVVAIAAGHYPESLALSSKPLTLWGACSSGVEIAGQAAQEFAVDISGAAAGSELRDLSVTGARGGILANGVSIVVDRLWVHDTPFIGIELRGGASTSSIARSLLERNAGVALQAIDSAVTLEDSVIRDAQRINGLFGRGLIMNGSAARSAKATILRSVIERTPEMAVSAISGTLIVEDSVIRSSTPEQGRAPNDPNIFSIPDGVPTKVIVRRSVLEGAGDCSVCVWGSELEVDHSSIRNSRSVAGGSLGYAIYARRVGADGSRVVVRQSLIDGAEGGGIVGTGAELKIYGTVVRNVLPRPGDQRAGYGIFSDHFEALPGKLMVDGCVVEDNHEGGVVFFGSEGEVRSTRISRHRETITQGDDGYGILAAPTPDGFVSSRVQVIASLVEDSDGPGIAVVGGELSVDNTLVRRSGASRRSGAGVGILAETFLEGLRPSSLRVVQSEVQDCTTAGIAVSGGDALVEATLVRDTFPTPRSGLDGAGIFFHADLESGAPATFTVRDSVVERAHHAGILNLGAVGAIANTRVSETRAQLANGWGGVGMVAQMAFEKRLRATMTVTDSLIDGCSEACFVATGAEVTLERVQIRGARARLGTEEFGDGLLAHAGARSGQDTPTLVTLVDSVVASSERAGVASFGAHVRMRSTRLDCNPIQLNGEDTLSPLFAFVDLGENHCSCGDIEETCRSLSMGLEPPTTF